MQRTFASLALSAMLLGSIALPCYAAASATAREPATPMVPCSSGDEPSPTLCAAAGTNAPLGVVAEDIPAPDVVQVRRAENLVVALNDGRFSSRNARNHSPSRSGTPLFLLHATLLI